MVGKKDVYVGIVGAFVRTHQQQRAMVGQGEGQRQKKRWVVAIE